MPLQPSAARDAYVRDNAVNVAKFILARVKKSGDCWLYQRINSATGYGNVHMAGKGKGLAAHRCALLICRPQENSQRIYACHTCPNKNCVNPAHLYWGTHQENMDDIKKDGTNGGHKNRGEKNYNAVMNEELVKEIWMDYYKTGASISSLGRKHGVAHSTIHHIFGRSTWRHVTDCLPCIRFRVKERLWNAGENACNAKLTNDKARAIYSKYASGKESQSRLAKEFECTPTTVMSIVTRRTWRRATSGLAVISNDFIKSERSRFPSPLSRLTLSQIKAIKKCFADGMSRPETAKHLGIKYSTVNNVFAGTTGRMVKID